MVVFLIKYDENTYPKGRAILRMYRVVPQTKRGNTQARENVLAEYPTSIERNRYSALSRGQTVEILSICNRVLTNVHITLGLEPIIIRASVLSLFVSVSPTIAISMYLLNDEHTR